MPTSKSRIAILRDELRKLARPHFKMAELGGDQEVAFEQAFSNLAHAYIKEKAPTLLDYEVGFQLVDKNEEGNKSIGIMGFKVGQQWLYVPIFWLSGDIKGHELLYIKHEDMFVPLKENWLNHLLNKKPNVLGASTGRNMREIGVLPPHLYQLSRSPHKFASVMNNMPDWAKEAMPTVAYMAVTNPATDPKFTNITSLPDFLKKEGEAVIKSLVLSFGQNPKLASVFDEFHGFSVIDEAIAEIAKRTAEANQTPSVIKNAATTCKKTLKGVRCFETRAGKTSVLPKMDATGGSVNASPGDLLKESAVGDPHDSHVTYALQEKPLQIVTYDEVVSHGSGLHDLSSADREKLVKDKILIKDKRPDSNKAYELQSTLRLQNPTETGLYDVLTKPTTFEKCLVVLGPYSQRGPRTFATVVRLSDGKSKAWLNIHPSHIFVAKQYTNEEFQDWWNKLEDCKSLPSGRGKYMIVGNTGQGSLPFSVDSTLSSDAVKSYDVYFDSYARKDRPDHLPRIRKWDDDGYWHEDGSRINLTGKRGAKLRSTGGDLYVPDDYKLITLRPAKDEKEDSPSCCFSCSGGGESDPPPIVLGNQLDIDQMIGIKTASIKIYSTGTEVDINGRRLQKMSGLIHLVRDWGLREKTARAMLKRADQQKVARFRVKYALQEYELQQTGPSAPGIPDAPTGYDPFSGGMVPTQQLGEYNLRVPDMSASKTDRMIYHPMGPDPQYQQPIPDHDSQNAALQAAQTGQKEIFDTAMIGSLLKAVRDDSMVDRYLGDLMKGLDRLGRILFLFYWHGERFEDRYGKSDMVELEDGLRNAFETLGDIVLFLKQRSIDAGPNDMLRVDLDEVAG